MASAPAFGEAALKGLKEMAARILNSDGSKQAPLFFPAPQMMDPVEEVTTKEQPGGNAIYDVSSTIKAVNCKVKWGGVKLSLLAALLGSGFSSTGTSPNRQHRLKRRTTDNAPEFELEGRIDYIGSTFAQGDYHFIGWRCKMVTAPKITAQFEDYVDLEGEIKILPRADGEFYDMVLSETGSAIAATADNVAPTVTSVPAAAATGTSNTNVVLTFSKPIVFEASKFALFSGTTVLTPKAGTATIDSSCTVVTITPTVVFGTQAFAWAATNVLDQSGNSVTATGTFTHT